MYNIFLLLLFCQFSALLGLDAFPEDQESFVNRKLEKLANFMGRKYFAKNRCVNVITEPGGLKSFRISNPVILLEVVSEENDCEDVLYGHFRNTFEHKCDGYIVQLENPDCALAGWYYTYRQGFIHRHNPKYFFLPLYPRLTSGYADRLFSYRHTDLSANLIAAEIDENLTDWSILFYTNNFYEHPSKAGRNPSILVEEWHHENGFKQKTDLYPDKILDLQGKPMRVACGQYLPFTSPDPLDGMEVRIARLFCEKHNCTPEPVEDEFSWGTVVPENYTGNGVCGNVYGDSADLGVMAVYLWLDFGYFIDYSASYLYGDVTVILPRPKRIEGWLTPFFPFKIDLWAAFFASLFLSAVSLFFLTKLSIEYTRFGVLLEAKKQFTTIADSTMRAIGLAILQTPTSRLIGDSPNRYLFTSFEFLYLVLSAMYAAELASFLTIPMYYPPIDEFHVFAKSGISWYGLDEAWTFALRQSPDPDALSIVQHFQMLPMDELKERAKEGKYGFPVDRMPGGSIAKQQYLSADVIPLYHVMKEKLFGSPLVAAIKKGGPYNEHFDLVVNKVVEHGFTLYWEADVARTYLDAKLIFAYQEAKVLHIDDEPSVIKLSHIEGILYIYVIGITLSFIVFIVEIFRSLDAWRNICQHFNSYKTRQIL